MKRFFAFLLTICTMLSCVGLFSACDNSENPPAHNHSFSQNWMKDENYHWNVCETIGCNEIANKGVHDWTGVDANTCTVCGKVKDQPGNNFSGEVTKEQWDLAVIAEKFNNVTINYGFFQTEKGEVKTELLIAGDKVLKTMKDVNLVIGYAGEQAKEQKSLVLDLFIGLLEKYENFTFDEQESVYISTDTITSTVTNDVSGYTAVETLTNGKVKFNSDYTIEWLSGDLTEEVFVDGQKIRVSKFEDMVFTFKDFGTTVVDIHTEVPYIPQANYTQVTEQQWIDSLSIKSDCQIDQTFTLLVNGEFHYVMKDGFIRSGNVIKYSDWYISIEGDKYFIYNIGENDKWTKKEIDEEQYIDLATFAELTYAFNKSTFDSETGLYICEELDIGDYQKYYNLKMGFVDGKIAYVYYEDKEEGGKKPVYQCYFKYTTIEVTLPTFD